MIQTELSTALQMPEFEIQLPTSTQPSPALLDLVSALSLPPVILLRFTDRQRHELSGHQVAESALVRNRAMPQQLGQHGQGLVGEILVDEGFLPGQSLGCTAGGLVIFFPVSLE